MSPYTKIPSSKPEKPILTRVLLADDHHIVRAGIRAELEKHSDIEVIGEASNGHEAIHMAQQLHPHVIVLDIGMPDMNGVETAERLKALAKPGWSPNILVLSAYSDREFVHRLIGAGARGYLLKDEPPRRIVEGVRAVMRGEPALSLMVQKILLTRQRRAVHDLSGRELEVLQLVAQGHTNLEIAETLVIAEGTVKNHVTNIYGKLDSVSTRSEAVAWAWQNRIVKIE